LREFSYWKSPQTSLDQKSGQAIFDLRDLHRLITGTNLSWKNGRLANSKPGIGRFAQNSFNWPEASGKKGAATNGSGDAEAVFPETVLGIADHKS